MIVEAEPRSLSLSNDLEYDQTGFFFYFISLKTIYKIVAHLWLEGAKVFKIYNYKLNKIKSKIHLMFKFPTTNSSLPKQVRSFVKSTSHDIFHTLLGVLQFL